MMTRERATLGHQPSSSGIVKCIRFNKATSFPCLNILSRVYVYMYIYIYKKKIKTQLLLLALLLFCRLPSFLVIFFSFLFSSFFHPHRVWILSFSLSRAKFITPAQTLAQPRSPLDVLYTPRKEFKKTLLTRIVSPSYNPPS